MDAVLDGGSSLEEVVIVVIAGVGEDVELVRVDVSGVGVVDDDELVVGVLVGGGVDEVELEVELVEVEVEVVGDDVLDEVVLEVVVLEVAVLEVAVLEVLGLEVVGLEVVVPVLEVAPEDEVGDEDGALDMLELGEAAEVELT